jgi:ATP-binding cassette subfamily F protein 3
MAVAIASNLGKDMAGDPLLRGVSFKLERGERMTLSGRNGAGKTTLLRMLAGETGIDQGELAFQKEVRIALHDQRPPRERGISLRDYVLAGCADLVALEQQLTDLEHAMADGATDDATLDRYGRTQTRLEHAGGYNWRERALATVRGLGFKDPDLDRPLSTFSGGELTRGSLARALAGDPDLLLLDEPTNHLDVESLEWLENRLQSIDAAVVLVAHDRWFLEAVGTSVLELEAGRGRFFKGTWHAWRKEQAARELALGRAIERQQAEIARLESFVTRFRAGTRAKQAQARVKKLDKMDRIETNPRDGKGLSFAFTDPSRSGRVVIEMENATIDVPGRTLLESADLWLERGEHVSLVGPNGAGKTTLIETLAGNKELSRGKLKRGHNAVIGYLSQHADELGTEGSVLEAAGRATGLTPNKARALLGRFLFSGEDAEKPIAGLSGGERRRLSLAIMVNSGANVLILDEPTNHLDLESREALEDALKAYPGTVLLVSHDRALLDAVGARTIAVEDGELHSYEGGWADYVSAREAKRAAEDARKASPKKQKQQQKTEDRRQKTERSAAAKPKTNGAAPSKNQKKRIAQIERDIDRAESALSALEDELADPSAWASPTSSARSTERHTAAKKAVEELYAQLESAGA